MERLTKDIIVVSDEVGKYLKLYEIPLSSDPLVWWNEKNPISYFK